MQTFQDVDVKLNSSITIPRQKITQMESTTEVKKTQPNPKVWVFFPQEKAKEIYILVLLIFPGKGPCLLTELQLSSFAFSSVHT